MLKRNRRFHERQDRRLPRAKAARKNVIGFSVPSAAHPGQPVLSGLLNWAKIQRRLRLSRREAQIIRCLLNGQKELAIARELGITLNTIKTHLRRLYRKIGVHEKIGLVSILVRTTFS